MSRSHVTRAVLGALCLLTVCAGLSSTAHAAVSYVACTQNNASAFWPYSLALTKPAGTQQNDLMVITVRTSAFYASGGGPSGWTEYLDGDGPTRTYYRVAGASEPGSYTFSNLPATSATTAVIASFRGVDTSAPILGTGAQGTGSGTSVSLAGTGLTVNRDGSMRYSGLTTNGNQTASYSGMTEGCDLGAGSASASFAYEAVNAGTLAARSATISGSANWTSQTLIAQGTETAPTVTNVAPASGPTAGGTSVTITGTGFSSASAVHFGGTSASYTVDSATQITATAPAGSAGTVDVRVTNPAGQSANTAADNYTYVAAPTVSGLAPSTGPAAGGTSVVITGTNLTGASAVTFGGAAASYTVDSATQITATAPAGSGTADVRVTTVGGQSANTAADNFTYVAAPSVTNLAPGAGPTAGGTSVVITGTNFTGVSAVTFGGTGASYTVDSPTQITATSPAGSAGTADVRVTATGGQSVNTAADNFTYVAAPTVTSLAPSSGPAAGGTSVVITGTNLTGASAVTFGGTNASGYTVDSATQITATAPAGTGTEDVRVTTVGGQSANTGSDDFTYIPAPTVTGIAPGSGPLAGGQSVVITGTNLTGATTVTFGGVGASFAVDSATQITATSPAGFAGTVDVRVTTPGGQSANTAADNYTYAQVPAVLSLAPDQGPLAGGTSVVITGTNLTGATAVTFGGTNATSFVVDSATQITATAPARAGVGLVNVRVTTPGGQSVNTPSDDYLYEDPCGGGGFDVTFPDFGFDPLTLNGLDQTGTRELTVPVADLTNLGLGWKVQIGTDRFESAGGDQLPADAARVAAVAASAVGGTCSMPSNGVTGYPITLPQNPAKVTVFNAAAGTGLGPASLDVDVELDVPASATTGTYTSTWTVDLTAAP